MRETVNAIEAWLGGLPGHVYANVRQPPISTLNLAHMMPFSAVWAGPERDEHLAGAAALLREDRGLDAVPVLPSCRRRRPHVDRRPDRRGQKRSSGSDGAAVPPLCGSQVFAFDFGGSIRAAALAMGGDWHDLGGALSDDVAEPVALQPLARIDDAGERAWAADWIADAACARNGGDHA